MMFAAAQPMQAKTLNMATVKGRDLLAREEEEGDVKPTQLHPPPTKPESRQDHLSQPESRTKGRKEADRYDSDHVEENDHQCRIYEAHGKQWFAQNPDGE
jgi:hypothetical protein